MAAFSVSSFEGAIMALDGLEGILLQRLPGRYLADCNMMVANLIRSNLAGSGGHRKFVSEALNNEGCVDGVSGFLCRVSLRDPSSRRITDG